MKVHEDAAVRAVLTPSRVLRLMELTLLAKAAGAAANPVRTVLSGGGGWFATMPARVDLGTEGRAEFDVGVALGAKLVTAFPRNREIGVPTHRALVALVDSRNGAFHGFVDGDAITELRTAAVSALAARRLAQRLPGTLAILGCGVQGHAHLEAFVDAGLVASLRVWSRSQANARRLADRAESLGVRTSRLCATARDALAGADLVVTATGAAEPLFSAEDVARGAVVCAVGACVPDRRELPARLVADAALVVDDRTAAEREAGDVLLARAELGRAIEPCAELGELLADPTRPWPPGARVALFESLGLGIEDVACAAAVLAAEGRRSRGAES